MTTFIQSVKHTRHALVAKYKQRSQKVPETMDEPSEEVKPEGWVNPMQQPEEVVLSEATEPLPAVTRPVTDLAMDVMAGKWGVGQDRRVALSEAGHDVKEIEAEVTRILNNQ